MPIYLRGLHAKAFKALCEAANEEVRCPFNVDLSNSHGNGVVPQLADMGLIQVEVYGNNYRVVEILYGEYKGKRTAEAPAGHKHKYTLPDLTEEPFKI